jgi:tetratricopeptide (TPR) repeat protein
MSRRGSRFSPLCFLLLLAFGTLAQTPAEIVDVTGTVFSEDGRQRLDNVMVNLCDPSGNLIQQGATMGGGEFAFRGLRRNEYVLKLSADSYQPAEVRVNLQFGSIRATFLYLKRIPSSQDRTSNQPSVSAHELAMSQSARELLVSGRKKLYRSNNPQGALDDFLRAQKLAAGFYELDYEIGMAYLNLGKTEKAHDSFANAVTLSKDNYGEAQIALGTLLVDKGELPEGEKKILRGIQLNPSLWMGPYQLARLELLRGQLQEAEADAEQARSLAPNAAINYRLLSVIHLREKKYKSLLADIDMYLELDPDSAAGQRARSVRDLVVQEIRKQEGQQTPPAENKDPG